MKKRQSGFAHVLVLLLLIVGLGTGLYLVSHPTIFKPKADFEATPSNIPATNFRWKSDDASTVYAPGQEFQVQLMVRSDVDKANLFVAKIHFPKEFISVSRIETDGSQYFIQNWVEKHFDNDTGVISLIGGVPTPGFKTQVGQPETIMATIVFRANNRTQTAAGQHIIFTPDSAIYRNTDNANILTGDNSGRNQVFLFGVYAPSPIPSSFSGEGGNCGVNDNPPQCQGGLICQVEIAPCTSAEGPYCDRAYPAFGHCIKPSPPPSSAPTACKQVFSKLQASYLASCDANVERINNNAYDPVADINKDKIVNAKDFSLIAGNYNDDAICQGYLKNQINPCQPSPSVECRTNSDCPTRPYFTAACVSPGICVYEGPGPPLSPGDGNHDGVVNLVDLSVLMSNFGKTIGFPEGIDLNDDRSINTVDYSLMVRLLISKGIIAQ